MIFVLRCRHSLVYLYAEPDTVMAWVSHLESRRPITRKARHRSGAGETRFLTVVH